MRAGEVMTRNVVTVRPDAMIREAAQMMDDLNVGALPVCNGRRLVGMITDRDIVVRSTANGMRPDATPVHAVMTDKVCWCFEDDSVDRIEDAMARRQIRRMPVVDQGKRLVGMITLGDLASPPSPIGPDIHHARATAMLRGRRTVTAVATIRACSLHLECGSGMQATAAGTCSSRRTPGTRHRHLIEDQSGSLRPTL
jgi:CBS domain-containing protein